MADKLDLFHIKFRDYLQEMIIGKTKKRIEPEREEDKELIEEEEDEDEKDDDELKLNQINFNRNFFFNN